MKKRSVLAERILNESKPRICTVDHMRNFLNNLACQSIGKDGIKLLELIAEYEDEKYTEKPERKKSIDEYTIGDTILKMYDYIIDEENTIYYSVLENAAYIMLYFSYCFNYPSDNIPMNIFAADWLLEWTYDSFVDVCDEISISSPESWVRANELKILIYNDVDKNTDIPKKVIYGRWRDSTYQEIIEDRDIFYYESNRSRMEYKNPNLSEFDLIPTVYSKLKTVRSVMSLKTDTIKSGHCTDSIFFQSLDEYIFDQTLNTLDLFITLFLRLYVAADGLSLRIH